MKKLNLISMTAASALLLAACGGGSDDPPARGSLVEAPATVATLSTVQIDAGVAAAVAAKTLPQLLSSFVSNQAKCNVKVVALNYHTPGVKGEDSNASAVMLVPVAPAAATASGACTTAGSGLVAYAKGTDVTKNRTLANPSDPDTLLLAAIYAAQGYTVVATDYLGYAKSAHAYHPYLHADSEASTVIDSVRAARNAATTVGATLSGKVMFTGYSQGGHSSMAAHRAAERDNAAEINVVAGAHLAGPYNLSGSLKVPTAIAGVQFFVPFLVTAWQKVYGDVYTDVTTVFKAPYASTIENLLPGTDATYTNLVTSGKLPGGTPTAARDALFQAAWVTNIQTSSTAPTVLAAKKNDLLGWSPKSKLLLCGGAGDPTVPPAVHQTVMKADFDSRALTNVTTSDVDASVQANFGPGGVAPTDPTSAAFAIYYGSYHGTYEPPFCHLNARTLFNTVK